MFSNLCIFPSVISFGLFLTSELAFFFIELEAKFIQRESGSAGDLSSVFANYLNISRKVSNGIEFDRI